MVLTIVYVCSLLTAFASKQVEACIEGYFGANCEFKCHCKLGTCDENGMCTPDRCHDSFFGPACQYLDLVVQTTKADIPEFVIDNDEETCNPERDQEYMEFSMSKPIILYWIRVYVNQPSLFTAGVPFFNIIVDRDEKCVNRQVFLGPNYMDITCTAIMMYRLSLMGKIVGSICSIYFSGGRNVAIKQNATQSSTWQDNVAKAGAQNAVDGSTNNDFESSMSCSRTKNNTQGSTWSVTFNYSQIIYSVVIFGELEERESVMVYSLHAFNSAGATVYTCDHDNEVSGVFITVSPLPVEPISSIVISLASNISNNILTLCEVQVFAETICPEGLFGLDCNKPCSCRYANMCHVVTGLCSSPEIHLEKEPGEVKETITVCPNGTYGDNCTLPCPSYCIVPFCEQLTGNCKTCDQKHHGDKCEECANNNYGPSCSESCPLGCLDSCDPKTGNCYACKSSFSGPKCDHVSISRVLILLAGTIAVCISVFLVLTFCLRRRTLKDGDSESCESSMKGTRSPQFQSISD